MTELSTIVNYIGSLHYKEILYQDPISAMGILKLLDANTTKLVFDLIGNTLHISQIRHIKNIKEDLANLIQTSLIKIEDGMVYLDPLFRDSVLRGFCLQNTDVSLSKNIHFKNVWSKTHQNSKDRSMAAQNDTNNLMDSQHSDIVRNLDILADSISNYKLLNLLQAVVNESTEYLFGIRDILLHCNLIDSCGQITNKGFEFLLMGRSDQYWMIITNSIRYFADNINEEIEMVKILLEMCTKCGTGIFTAEKCCKWLSFLNSLGIIHIISFGNFQRTRDEPTMLETTIKMGLECGMTHVSSSFSNSYEIVLVLNNSKLFMDEGAKKVELQAQKYIILETNYKIYAYTTRHFEKNILDLFSRTVYMLPNLIKAQMDEESVLNAFSRGITAKQIIKYLMEFAKEVPNSIINQINIWEGKLHRIRVDSSVLYTEFLHLSDYLSLLRFLEQKNAVIHKDEIKRIIIGTEETYEEAKQFLRGL